MALPMIIQGGMGVAVSGWPLARAVSQLGQLGVVSGTALGVILARRLQLGDPGGHLRRAMDHFPVPEIAERLFKEYYVPGGKGPRTPFRLTAMPTLQLEPELAELTVVANFVEVYLAKEGHDGVVGINYLEKIQIPMLASMYGAMLANVDYILMGAGIPRAIPGALDQMAVGEVGEQRVDVEGAGPDEEFLSRFDPKAFCGGRVIPVRRPWFLGIVASATLAMTLARKSTGRVDGFVVEGETAGGHNAPPRGPLHLSQIGEPVYGPRDVPDLEKIRALGLPFWLAGSYGRPGKVGEAMGLGAAGIQVGTAFAFCEESGMMPEFKREAIRLSRAHQGRVFTDPLASPTGFPFKVVEMKGTLSEPELFAARQRTCELGYLRHPYRKEDGTLGYRCPAEPVDAYVRKGGNIEDTHGRKCICNGLPATVGLGQVRMNDAGEAVQELALITAGNDAVEIARLIPPGQDSYTAADVVKLLLGDSPPWSPEDA